MSFFAVGAVAMILVGAYMHKKQSLNLGKHDYDALPNGRWLSLLQSDSPRIARRRAGAKLTRKPPPSNMAVSLTAAYAPTLHSIETHSQLCHHARCFAGSRQSALLAIDHPSITQRGGFVADSWLERLATAPPALGKAAICANGGGTDRAWRHRRNRHSYAV